MPSSWATEVATGANILLLGLTRTTIEAIASGAVMGKSVDEAYELLKEMASNNYQWPSERLVSIRKVVGVHEIDVLIALVAQVNALSNKFDSLGVHAMQSPSVTYELCRGNHSSDKCFINAKPVQYFGNFNRQQHISNSNFYNPSWRNHSNFFQSNNLLGKMP